MFWLLLAASIILFCIGALSILAGGMSDAPYEGERAASQGLVMVIIAVVILILDFVLRHYHLLG